MKLFGLYGIACSMTLLASTAAFALPKATEVYPKMGLGYNIGNTMEVPGNPTAWGNDFPSAEYVKAIKDAGFNTVRIPCAWDSHASNGTINAGWLDSVKTVVDYVIDNGMYAILNSHWDNGWLEDHVWDGDGYDRDNKATTNDAAAVAAKQESYWKQIATKFADYDEHLIFASANEPGVNDPRAPGDAYGDNGQWTFDSARMAVLKLYHEACLKGVRATGGNNATRIIVVQAPRTEIDKASLLSDQYPTDPTGDGYTMAEVHFYPYQFSLMTGGDESWGNMFYYWEDKTPGDDAAHTCSGSALGSKSSIDQLFSGLKSRFYDKGIPVVIGEMGAVKRLNLLSGDNLKAHLEARAAWYGYTVAAAKENGLVPCVWDTGDEGDGNFTIIRRQTSKYGGNVGDIVDVETLNAMREAYDLAELPGNSIDSLVNESTDSTNKMLEVTYTSARTDSSETGTVRLDFGGVDWSQYVALSFDAKVSITTKPVGTDEYGWYTLSTFAMSGDEWDWSDYNIENADISTAWKTYKINLDITGLNITDKSKVQAFGINLYGSQPNGTIDFDNLVLYKADGSTVVLENFDKNLPTIEGVASAKLVVTTDNLTVTAIKPVQIATASKMFVNVQPGMVNATFTAAATAPAKAMLMNAMGQVIAQQNFNATKGANSVELRNNYRGPAMLLVKQGSQRYMQKVILK